MIPLIMPHLRSSSSQKKIRSGRPAAEDMGCHKKKMSGYNRVSAKPTTKYPDKADKEHYDSQSVPTYEANLTIKQKFQSPNVTF